MPLLNPPRSVIEECLEEAGLKSRSKNGNIKALEDAGLTQKSALNVLHTIMHTAEKEELRHKAATDVLRMYGMLDKDEKSNVPSIVFNISGNVQLNNVLLPDSL